MNEIKPIAMPGTHQNFLKYFNQFDFPKDSKILDIGAGHGAFTKELHEQGYEMAACDLFPEMYYYDQVPCDKSDITEHLPYPDNHFDIAIAIEVSEHIHDHGHFFREVSRVLKPGALFFMSTPNILSLKSRMRFLVRGFYYAFGPLDMERHDGLQHVASLTINQYQYIGMRHGFEAPVFEVDKRQSSSTWWFRTIYPFIWMYNQIKGNPKEHNHNKLLTGRLLFLKFSKR